MTITKVSVFPNCVVCWEWLWLFGQNPLYKVNGGPISSYILMIFTSIQPASEVQVCWSLRYIVATNICKLLPINIILNKMLHLKILHANACYFNKIVQGQWPSFRSSVKLKILIWMTLFYYTWYDYQTKHKPLYLWIKESLCISNDSKSCWQNR